MESGDSKTRPPLEDLVMYVPSRETHPDHLLDWNLGMGFGICRFTKLPLFSLILGGIYTDFPTQKQLL